MTSTGAFSGEQLGERRRSGALLVAWQVGLLIAFLSEAARLKFRLLADATPGQWLGSPALDGTFLFPCLLLGPFCWKFSVAPPPASRLKVTAMSAAAFRRWSWGLALGAGLLLLMVSIVTAERRFGEGEETLRLADAAPVVHDEFSYLLQARTFLAGRWFWPGPTSAPELFHQLHVLNEGKYASRYPPGTGAWLSPWLALGHPVWGERCACALSAIGLTLLACRLPLPIPKDKSPILNDQFSFTPHSGSRWQLLTGAIAGLLLGLAPGAAIFSNLLLAHGPCLLGLALFLYSVWQLLSGNRPGWAWAAGIGLTLAMLCRPLTAAAVAFPFGVCLLTRRPSQALIAGLGIPLACGFFLLGWQNHALTGDIWTTPYALYTKLYTPRHVYGFANGGAQPLGDAAKVLAAYNDWAANLDFPRSIENLQRRLAGSFAWALGIVPLSMTAVYFALTFREQLLFLRLLLASIVCLHAVHGPYWLDGMLQHHYVFESGPLWLLLAASVSTQLLALAWRRGQRLFLPWWGTLICLSVAANHLPLGLGETRSRIELGLESFTRPTRSDRAFRQLATKTFIHEPALILVQTGPADLHGSFVRNAPPFNAPTLIAWDRPELYAHEQLQRLFPDRHLYVFSAERQTLTALPFPVGEAAP